jgi:Ca2+-binding RTX toxin-like protein
MLDGGAGNDVLVAGKGTQVLIGGPGDTLTRGHGSDTFVFAPDFGMNTITKFNPLLDKIQLPASEFANFAAVQSHMQQVGANTVIAYDAASILCDRAAPRRCPEFVVNPHAGHLHAATVAGELIAAEEG